MAKFLPQMKALAAGVVVIGMATATLTGRPANAAITLETPGSMEFQQTLNHPCIMGDPSCQNPAGFDHTVFPPNGGGQTYDTFSPTYTVGQITTLLGSHAFIVGIDVNTTTHPNATEQLDYFAMLVNGVALAANTFDPASPGATLVNANNGNGHSDALLKGFDLTGLNATDQISFHAIVTNATDGREEFFLARANDFVLPEPASFAIFGAGLLGLGLVTMRRRSFWSNSHS